MVNSSYPFRLLRQAFQMTQNDVGFVSPKAAILRIVFAAITLLVIYFGADIGSALDQLGGYWFTFLALVAWAGLVFLFNLILSPWQLQKKADERIAELENIIDDEEAQQNALNRLWELRSEGIALRNEPIQTEAQFTDWRRRYEEWRKSILEVAGERSANLREWLRRLERMGKPPGRLTFYVGGDTSTGKPTKEHYRLASIMTEILVRLQKHLERDLK